MYGNKIVEMHKRHWTSFLCKSCQTIISMREANPPCVHVSFEGRQKKSRPRLYSYTIMDPTTVVDCTKPRGLLPCIFVSSHHIEWF